jgi:hypothetical protein
VNNIIQDNTFNKMSSPSKITKETLVSSKLLKQESLNYERYGDLEQELTPE